MSKYCKHPPFIQWQCEADRYEYDTPTAYTICCNKWSHEIDCICSPLVRGLQFFCCTHANNFLVQCGTKSTLLNFNYTWRFKFESQLEVIFEFNSCRRSVVKVFQSHRTDCHGNQSKSLSFKLYSVGIKHTDTIKWTWQCKQEVWHGQSELSCYNTAVWASRVISSLMCVIQSWLKQCFRKFPRRVSFNRTVLLVLSQSLQNWTWKLVPKMETEALRIRSVRQL